MTATLPLDEFVTLGQRLYVLMNPSNVNVVATEIVGFLESLDTCGLRRSRTAAEPLSTISSIPYSTRTGNVNEVARIQLRAYLDPIHRTLYSELSELRAIAVDSRLVSQELRKLSTDTHLTDIQSALLQETITCIECGAYRAGVVMGWNLAYDYIRQWIFDGHLTEFNAELTTRYLRKNGTACYDAIMNYDDFCTGNPDERTVIDTCHFASLIGERLRDNLRYYLRRRNNYAHPTFTSPSAEQSNGYIKDLLDTIKGQPFAP